MMQTDDDRQYAPATERNREPILAVLQEILPPTGAVLEISSGTGEHAVFFAPQLAPRQWIPSDMNPIALASIAAWRTHCPAPNLLPPLALNVCDSVWAIEPTSDHYLDLKTEPIRAIVTINMIHIAPWEACLGLMAGAGRILPPQGVLYLYGPFKREGKHTAPSNAAFDESLQLQNSAWGVRNLEDVIAVAQNHQLALLQVKPMPANNLSVVFHKQV